VVCSAACAVMKPSRPNLLQFSSLRELYLHFERVFLQGSSSSHTVVSSCGHTITIFDHHFFHMVKLTHPNKPRPLNMLDEKENILGTSDGFGPYEYEKHRAIYLESAMLCLLNPDEVWGNPGLESAKWVYIKHFATTPYTCTIFLVGERPEGLVPITSFPGRNRDIKKWGRGTRIYPKTHLPPFKGGR
jgi:hypothetical protein